jgi:hypothetical protein
MRLWAVRGLNTPDVRFCLVARVSDSRFLTLCMAPPPVIGMGRWAAGAGVHHEPAHSRPLLSLAQAPDLSEWHRNAALSSRKR